MPQRIQIRRGTAAQWTTSDPVLAVGEIGFETDTGTFKIGDGAAAWSALSYFAGGLTTEQIQDMIDTFIVAGTGITKTYNDAGNTLTIAATGGGSTNPLLLVGNEVKLVYVSANTRWEFPDGTVPTLTARTASITWEGTAAQIPAQGTGDANFQVGDTALIRAESL